MGKKELNRNENDEPELHNWQIYLHSVEEAETFTSNQLSQHISHREMCETRRKSILIFAHAPFAR